MPEIHIRKQGRAGCGTLARPDALNALTAGMLSALEDALDTWRQDDDVHLVVLDAEGDRAFCAGGDIADLYAAGSAGDFAYGQSFWRQEYRLNLKIAEYPKPIVALMQGFTLGGGVGVACHASHRIVGESSRVAMPECSIGLIPDVGGSWILGRAPDGIGAYLGLTGARMTAADAIYAGFADHFVPEQKWGALRDTLVQTGDVDAIAIAEHQVPASELARTFEGLAECFSKSSLAAIAQALRSSNSGAAQGALKALGKAAPLALACGLQVIRSASSMTLQGALAQEYRFAFRAQQQGDFLEGIRAQIIDRDFAPVWRHSGFDVPQAEVAQMLAPLGADEWVA